MTKLLTRVLIRLWPAIVPPALLVLLAPIRDSGALSVLAGNVVNRQEMILVLIYLFVYLATFTFTPIMIVASLIDAANRWWIQADVKNERSS